MRAAAVPSSVLTRYIALRVLFNTALVLLTVVAILSVVELVDEARAVSATYAFADALWVILYTTPERLYEILPVAVFIGALIALGQMAGDSEMVALRAAGTSLWRIVRTLLIVGIGISALAIVIGEYIAPAGTDAARRVHQGGEANPAHSVWTYRDGRYVHARLGTNRFAAADILIYEVDGEHRLRQKLYAERAAYTGDVWRLHNVRISRIDPDGRIHVAEHPTLEYSALPPPDVLRLLSRSPNEMAGTELRRYLAAYAVDGIDARHYQFAWWQRIMTPLSCIVVLLLTLPFGLAQGRSGGMAQRAFWGVVAGLVIYLFNRVGGHAGFVAGLEPALAAALPVSVLFLFGIALLGTHQRLRAPRAR